MVFNFVLAQKNIILNPCHQYHGLKYYEKTKLACCSLLYHHQRRI